jgi:D-alanyl-D-alanine carboxypeptidase
MLATGPQRVRTAGRSRRVVLATATATAVVVGLIGASGTGRAGAAPAARSGLAHLAHRLVERGSPGAIVVVRTPGGVRRAAAGVSRLGPRSAMHASDRYRVASVTKPFVAAVVLDLVADGRLRLGDSVERWLPGVVPNGRAVTIRELLGHTSGLFDYDQDDAWVKARIAAPARVWTPRQLVAVATRHPPLFAPGTDWSYSNTNYVLLGLVVERITRHSLGEELDARIVGPLGLHATSYPVGAGLSGSVAHGYQGAAPGLPIPAGRLVDVTTRVSPSAWGAGQLVSDADDLTRFFAALLGGRVLPSAELRDMTSPVSGGKAVPFTVGYGLGLDIFHTSCGIAYGHLGDMPGYRNVVMARPDGRRVVAVMANVSSERLRWEEIQRTASTAFCTG